MSRFRDAMEFHALRLLFAHARRLDDDGAHRLGGRLGDFIYGVLRIRREVAHANLRMAFPEWDASQVRSTARECYRTFARTVAEFARLPMLGASEVVERVTIEGRAWLDEVCGGGTGAILVTGHFGNWECVGALFPALGIPIDVVVGDQRNRRVDALMNQIRRAKGVGILSADTDRRGILRSLRGGRIVAIVADQDAGRDGIFVDFLGRPASTAIGPAALARRFGVPILLGFATRTGAGRHTLRLYPPIRVAPDGDEDAAVGSATEQWSRILEGEVRRRPDHWFWMHRRWKTRPGPRAVRGERSVP